MSQFIKKSARDARSRGRRGRERALDGPRGRSPQPTPQPTTPTRGHHRRRRVSWCLKAWVVYCTHTALPSRPQSFAGFVALRGKCPLAQASQRAPRHGFVWRTQRFIRSRNEGRRDLLELGEGEPLASHLRRAGARAQHAQHARHTREPRHGALKAAANAV